MVPLERTVSFPLTVPPTTLDLSSLSCDGSLSTMSYVTFEKPELVAVSVHDVVWPAARSVGVHSLVKVTAAWRRTIVTGMWSSAVPPLDCFRVIIPKRVWPSGTKCASIVTLNEALAPAATSIDFGTVIEKSLGLEVVSFQVESEPMTLWAVRETVTTPGIFGWKMLG
jgi:hypothetical protein